MANKRIKMDKVQEIQRLKKLGHTKSKVAKILGIDRGAIIRHWNQEHSDLDNNIPAWTREIDWDHLNEELQINVPRKALYEELSAFISMPSYQAFCQYIREHQGKKTPVVTTRIERNPGDSVEVDYSGDGQQVLNPSTGELRKAELFVGASSYSGRFFAEFTPSQRLEDFISSHNHMFFYFGGIHRYIIPDNCKTAVTKTDKYDPLINQTYRDMCAYYGIAIDPADSASPRHKPNVERAVGIIQKSFFPRIRHKRFTSLIEINRELKAWMNGVNNNTVIRGRGNTRAFFFKKERPCLSALPESPYELFYFTKRKIHPDCHFQHQKNYYSVPYNLVGEEVDIKFNSRMVYAYSKCQLIAAHRSQKGSYHYSTNTAHYPERKYVDVDYNLNQVKKNARQIGPHTSALIERLANEARHPLKILRKSQGIVGLAKSFSLEALEYGCQMAVEFNRINYDNIKRFAKNYTKPKSSILQYSPQRQLEFVFLQGEGNERSS